MCVSRGRAERGIGQMASASAAAQDDPATRKVAPHPGGRVAIAHAKMRGTEPLTAAPERPTSCLGHTICAWWWRWAGHAARLAEDCPERWVFEESSRPWDGVMLVATRNEAFMHVMSQGPWDEVVHSRCGIASHGPGPRSVGGTRGHSYRERGTRVHMIPRGRHKTPEQLASPANAQLAENAAQTIRIE